MKHFYITALFLVISIIINAQNIIITGKEKSYAGDELVIKNYADYITHIETELGKCIVDTNGSFKFSFPLKKTSLAFMNLGIFKGYIFLEPDSVYEIKIPKKKPKTFEDKINPYYKESEFYIGVTNSSKTELNYVLRKFDNQFDDYLDNYFNIIRQDGSRKVDTMINKLNSEFQYCKNDFFKDYMFYKFTELRNLAYERDRNYVVKYYYSGKPILYNNPAYMELFNKLFSNFFYTYSKTKYGNRIYQDVAYSKSISRIKETLSNSMAYTNDTLQELIILKSCYDECYSNSFPFSSIIQTIDSLKQLTTIPEHKKIATNIKNKVLELHTGYTPPKIELTDRSGAVITLDSYKGKYIYLNFCSSWSYTCKEEFTLLKELQKNHNNTLQIVSISLKNDYNKLTALFKEKNYDWPLLYFTNETILNKYQVKAFPSYFLISPKGKLVMSPAPSPNENFEWKFYKIIQSQK